MLFRSIFGPELGFQTLGQRNPGIDIIKKWALGAYTKNIEMALEFGESGLALFVQPRLFDI